MIVFRQADPRFPFLWETGAQPPGRWHGVSEGPVHYFADTPVGAWAELLRHEEISDPADLAGIRRGLWAVEISEMPRTRPKLADPQLLGGVETYAECRAEAARLRARGVVGLRAPSAALRPRGAGGWRVERGLQEGPPRDGEVVVLFGRRPDLVGWPITLDGRPPDHVLERVRHFRSGGRS